MSKLIEMGKISSRGQVAIPTEIRNQLGLEDGSRVLFFTEDGILMIKKITDAIFQSAAKWLATPAI